MNMMIDNRDMLRSLPEKGSPADTLNPDAVLERAREMRAVEVGEALGSALRAIGRFVDKILIAPVRRWREQQQAYRELMSLDDHVLHDIGITRADIPYVVRGRPPARRRAANDDSPRKAA